MISELETSTAKGIQQDLILASVTCDLLGSPIYLLTSEHVYLPVFNIPSPLR